MPVSLYMECKMTLISHESYTIEIEDNILNVNAHGLFDDGATQQYNEDMRVLVHQMQGQPWGSLVTYHGNGIFSPEAEESLTKMTKYRVKFGMVANATVILNNVHADVQQMQLQRIYHPNHIIFHVFSDHISARNWLSHFLQKQKLTV